MRKPTDIWRRGSVPSFFFFSKYMHAFYGILGIRTSREPCARIVVLLGHLGRDQTLVYAGCSHDCSRLSTCCA